MMDSKHELSVTQLGPRHISGATNYYLPIYSYDPQNKSDHVGQVSLHFI
jgi:hypothetical protein